MSIIGSIFTPDEFDEEILYTIFGVHYEDIDSIPSGANTCRLCLYMSLESQRIFGGSALAKYTCVSRDGSGNVTADYESVKEIEPLPDDILVKRFW